MLNSNDLEIDVIPPKSSWVLKPTTEVRIKHKPTGFAVRCNATRSQHKNKDIAMQYLMSYLEGLRCLN